jgi:nuclear pore complex protein Nup205
MLIWILLGKLDIDGGYSVNEEFQQGAKKLADTLDLDELLAARLLLEAEGESEATGRSLLTCSIVRFHQRRKEVLDCIRLVLELAADVDREQNQRDGLLHLVDQTVKPENAPNNCNDSQRFIRRCLAGMGDIKSGLHKLAEISNTGSITGQHSDILETIEYQRVSLVKQHELLGIIVFYLVKQNYTVVADFELVLGTLKTVDKFDNLLCKQTPSFKICQLQRGNHSVCETRLTCNSALLPCSFCLHITIWQPGGRSINSRGKSLK